MVMIANYQYGWTFFVPDIQKTFGWDRASIQWAFTLFVLFETWLVPVEGWFVDKYGPRVVVLIGGILCAVGWAINAHATTLNGYYLGMIVAGIGAGGVYGTCVGNALKWFPDKRGLAAGITAARIWRRLCPDGCADPGDDQRFLVFKAHCSTSGLDRASLSSSFPSSYPRQSQDRSRQPF